MKAYIEGRLLSWGMDGELALTLASVAVIALIVLAALVVYWILCVVLLRMTHKLIRRTSNRWDDALVEGRVFRRALGMIPLVLILFALDHALPGEFEMIRRILSACIVLVAARAVEGLVQAASRVYHRTGLNQRKPIRPLFQSAIIIDYIFAGIIAASVLLDKDPWSLLTLLGGMTAVIMLVFRDTILGFVAGIQLSANDMVQEGDWIEMPSQGADGDVIEVTVNTVKVQNWDKTISTIPTYALVTQSFKNWRGMSESGGRRIKRNLCIDMNTIRFADEAMLERFRKMDLLADYVIKKQEEIDSSNAERRIDLSATVVNGRRQTNLGLFRAYLVQYLRTHPKIHKDMTFLVRHLQPTPQGLPIEIYVFSNDQAWVNYEGIQADIFDHTLAALPEFGLRVFQQPTGTDFRGLGETTRDTAGF